MSDSRRAYTTLFDLMEQYQEEHPEATDDECYEAVCFGRDTQKIRAAIEGRKADEYRNAHA